MDRKFNSKSQDEKIYAIYKACRLCGAGGGFKMPIIQNVVDLDENGVELRQKIRECVQLEVKLNDRMPPLICEFCIDKINDFYEFLELCQQTNKRTRMQLGLPQQELQSENCTLGLTKRVVVKNEEDEPLSKQKVKVKEEKSVIKEIEKKVGKEAEKKGVKEAERKGGKETERKGGKETERKVKVLDKKVAKPDVKVNKELEALWAASFRDSIESENLSATRSSRGAKRAASPSPVSARPSRSKPDEKQDTPSPVKKNKDVKKKEPSPAPPKKRTREADAPKLEVLPKKVKIQPPPPKPVKPAPKCKKPKPATQPTNQCAICGVTFKTPQAMISHQRIHVVTFTDNKLACNACGSWFVDQDQAAAHHKKHKKIYECTKCYQTYTTNFAFDAHQKSSCIKDIVSPEVQCVECWKFFITDTLRSQHECLGVASRPEKCKNCDRLYQTKKSLQRHENTCSVRKKDGVKVQADVLCRLMPLQIRVAKCDPLLQHDSDGCYDVSAVLDKYGLDPTCVYPYTPVRIKSEPISAYDEMVNINDDFHQQYLSDTTFVHWDEISSDEESDSNKTVNNLSTICLKTLFSNKCLGKVPRKVKKIKPENVFDSLFSDSNVTKDINRIISGINADDDSNDSLFGGNSTKPVSNADFDLLSNNSAEQSILKGFVGNFGVCEDSGEVDKLTNVSNERSDTDRNEEKADDTEIETVLDNSDNADMKSNNTSIVHSDNNVETNESNLDMKSDKTSMDENDSQQTKSDSGASKCDRILNEQESEEAVNTEDITPDKGDTQESESANTDTVIDTSADGNNSVNESETADTTFYSTSMNKNESEVNVCQSADTDTNDASMDMNQDQEESSNTVTEIKSDFTITENNTKVTDPESVIADTEVDQEENNKNGSESVNANVNTKSDITALEENQIHGEDICVQDSKNNTQIETNNTSENANAEKSNDKEVKNKSEQTSNVDDSLVSNKTKEPIKENENSNLHVDENESYESESTSRSELKIEASELQKTDQNNDNEQNCISPNNPEVDLSNENSNSVSSKNVRDANESKDSIKDCESDLDVSHSKENCRLSNTVNTDEAERSNEMDPNISHTLHNKQENINEFVTKDTKENVENSTISEEDLTKRTEDSKTNGIDENSKNSTNGNRSDAEEMDDDKLMDEINKQIGESKESENDSKNSSGDKITLEDLIQVEKPVDKSLELDNISDEEFNFDS